jgi:hypothetical protein
LQWEWYDHISDLSGYVSHCSQPILGAYGCAAQCHYTRHCFICSQPTAVWNSNFFICLEQTPVILHCCKLFKNIDHGKSHRSDSGEVVSMQLLCTYINHNLQDFVSSKILASE